MLLVAVAIWGANFIVVKIGISGWFEFPFVAARFWIATLSFLPFLLWEGSPERPGSLHPLVLACRGVAAGICLFLAYSAQAYALRYTTASKGALLTALCVVLVPFIHGATSKRLPSRRDLAASSIAAAGAMLLVGMSGMTLVGFDLLLVASAFFYALQIVIVGSLPAEAHSLRFTAIQMSTIAWLATIASLPSVLSPGFFMPGIAVLAALVFTGVVASALAYYLQTRAQRRISPVQAGVIFAMEPVFATITAFFALREPLTPQFLLGGCLVIAATLLTTLPIRKPKQAAIQ